MARAVSYLMDSAAEAAIIPRPVALKALTRIAARWGLKKNEIPELLGRAPRTVRDWFRTDRGSLEPDVNERISHLIGIFDGLHRLFGDNDYADQWIREQNAAFGGLTPLQLLMTGRFTAIVEIRRYIEESLAL